MKRLISLFNYYFNYPKYEEDQKLKDGFVKCVKCGKWWEPIKQVGICPHENFEKWLYKGVKK